MDYYKLHLPKSNHWNDEYESWIENSYSRGSADYVLDIEQDDKYGVGKVSMIEDIPILIGGETEDLID